jgi:hypothetical protein
MFVTGHPRSGTTITHAMICSSDMVNDYIPESSYLTGLVRNFAQGFQNDEHNVDFFGSKQAFVDYGGKQIRNFINDCWIAFGSPKVLALKDPVMMDLLDVYKGLFPFAKFVISLRDPFEVVSSFCNVKRREGVEVTDALTRQLAHNAAVDYARALRFKQANPDATLLFHYDSLFDDSYASKFAAFDASIQCTPDKVWDSKFVDDAGKTKSPWMTKKYGQKLDGVKKTVLNLSDAQRQIIEQTAMGEYNKVLAAL